MHETSTLKMNLLSKQVLKELYDLRRTAETGCDRLKKHFRNEKHHRTKKKNNDKIQQKYPNFMEMFSNE